MNHKYRPMCDEGAMQLSAAIVETAVEDWHFLIRTGRDAVRRQGRAISVTELRTFFHGPLFESMMDVVQVSPEKAVAILEEDREKSLVPKVPQTIKKRDAERRARILEIIRLREVENLTWSEIGRRTGTTAQYACWSYNNSRCPNSEIRIRAGAYRRNARNAEIVRLLDEAGKTWTEIGPAVGLTASAAQKIYRKAKDGKHDDAGEGNRGKAGADD